jgi:hypothetical protein
MRMPELKMSAREVLWFSVFALALLRAAGQMPMRSSALDSPVTAKTAVSFFWFGDMDSHFRSPINFYVAPEGDRKLNTVVVESAGPAGHQWSAFISSSEMQRLIDGLKALDLRWNDFKGREAFKPGLKRADDGFLDITVVSSKATAKAYVRIARMCDELLRLDPAMPSPRILWQFQLFRVDNGCQVPGYNNSVIPPG